MRNPKPLLVCVCLLFVSTVIWKKMTEGKDGLVIACQRNPSIACMDEIVKSKTDALFTQFMDEEDFNKQKRYLKNLERFVDLEQRREMVENIQSKLPEGDFSMNSSQNTILALKAAQEIVKHQNDEATSQWIETIKIKAVDHQRIGSAKALSTLHRTVIALQKKPTGRHYCSRAMSNINENDVPHNDRFAKQILQAYLEIFNETLDGLSEDQHDRELGNAINLAVAVNDLSLVRQLLNKFISTPQRSPVSFPTFALLRILEPNEVIGELERLGIERGRLYEIVAGQMIKNGYQNKEISPILSRGFDFANVNKVGLGKGLPDLSTQRRIVRQFIKIDRLDLAIEKAHEMNAHTSEKFIFPAALHAAVAATYIDVGLLPDARLALNKAKETVGSLSYSIVIPQLVRLGEYQQAYDMILQVSSRNKDDAWRSVFSSSLGYGGVEISLEDAEEMLMRAGRYRMDKLLIFSSSQFSHAGRSEESMALVERFYTLDAKADSGTFASAALAVFNKKIEGHYEQALHHLVNSALKSNSLREISRAVDLWRKCVPTMQYN